MACGWTHVIRLGGAAHAPRVLVPASAVEGIKERLVQEVGVVLLADFEVLAILPDGGGQVS